MNGKGWSVLEELKKEDKMSREIPHLGLSRNQLLACNRYQDPNVNEGIFCLLDQCTDREITVIALRLGMVDGKIYSLEEVGEMLGVTRERIRQIESYVIHKIWKRTHPRTRRKSISDFYR